MTIRALNRTDNRASAIVYSLGKSFVTLTLHRATPVSSLSIKLSRLILSSGYRAFSHSARSSFIAIRYSSEDLNGLYDLPSSNTDMISTIRELKVEKFLRHIKNLIKICIRFKYFEFRIFVFPLLLFL